MGSFWGRYLTVATFGESHGSGVGAVIDGIPPGVAVDAERIQRELDRRRPGTSPWVSARREPDRVEILSGIDAGRTLGFPIALLVRNQDARSDDYTEIREIFRPGHADYTYFKKYGLPPQPGGGRASGRETVGRVAAGGVAKAFLEPRGVLIRACTVQVGAVRAARVDLDLAESDPLRCADPDRAEEMARMVATVRESQDSVGGVVQVMAQGVPPGLGDPVFQKLDAVLGGAMLSVGGVKGVEFGTGFELAAMRGSLANDPMTPEGFASNHAGGVLGGISTGQPIVLRLAVKPTPSIALPQDSVDIHGQARTVRIRGRHDPCLCPRIVPVAPVAEAMCALVLADAVLQQIALSGGKA
jgi:chorismate synthase